MSSAAIGAPTHAGGGPLSLMSCVRESSPLQDYDLEVEKNVATKRKFWNVKKWFKRKHHKETIDQVVTIESTNFCEERDVLRRRSTSELSISDEQTRRISGGSTSMYPGLSVSHDSVFHSPNSTSELDLDQAQSTSSLSTSHPHVDSRLQTELSERLKLRRGHRGDTSEDDEGLPHSPCNSPTTTDKTAIKDLPTKSHSTCSDGSLLSMGSSEMDDDTSRNSSKLSLTNDNDFELSNTPVLPLDHSAAHHRVSVRPNKRRAPHRSRQPQLSNALPATPEVNEDTNRCTSPVDLALEAQLKCSSLPPGLVGPVLTSDSKLNRSQSNASSKANEDDEMDDSKEGKSLLNRIFLRRSNKKRKSKENRPIAAPRSGPASRQRIQPIDLPLASSPSPEFDQSKSIVPSPVIIRHELENRIKMAGLTSLQQKVLSLNDDDIDSFKSLDDGDDVLSKKVTVVTKSHSFRTTETKQQVETSGGVKASSLDDLESKVSDVSCTDDVVTVEPFIPLLPGFNGVTVSGPSHTAVVNVSNGNVTRNDVATSGESVSVTKISVETTVPEFLNCQLNKVEARPSTNVVFSTNSPRIVDEVNKRQKKETVIVRKFSQEDLEIVDRSSPQPMRFKKNENVNKNRKSSVNTPSGSPTSNSVSLDSLKIDLESDKSSQDSLDAAEDTKKVTQIQESIVLRKRSQIKSIKTDDEPELMKVFARRSLKLKDSESESVSQQITSMLDDDRADEIVSDERKFPDDDVIDVEAESDDLKFIESTEVILRKPMPTYQRTVSLLPAKIQQDPNKLKKQSSFTDKFDWIQNCDEVKISQDEIHLKNDFITTKPKNFNQRKAEWEKRAQLAQKKTVP